MWAAACAAGVWCGSAAGAGWLPSEEVHAASSQLPATLEQPAVAMTPAGDVFVAWTVSGQGGATEVLERVRRSFTGFGTFIPLGLGDHPVATTDPDGRIWIAAHDAANQKVELARGNATDPSDFNESAAFAAPGSVTDVDLAARHEAGAVAYVESGQVKLGRLSVAGGAAGPTTTYDGSLNAADHARLTLDPAGNLVTAFTISSSNNECRVAAVRVPAGGPAAPLQDIGSTGNADGGCSFHANGVELNDNVDLALGPTGRVLASWYQNGPVHTTINAAVAAPGAAFGPTATTARDDDPLPLTGGNPPSIAHGLLGASDAMLQTYVVRSPADGFIHAGQQFRPSGAAAGTVRAFDVGSEQQPLAGNAAGQAAGAWIGFDNTNCRITGAIGTIAGGLAAPQPIGACGAATGASTGDPRVAMDPGGDAAVAWGAGGGVELAVYDATPPLVSAVDAPATATAGAPASFSATARDALSPTHVDWAFDDGATLTGDAVSHAFTTPGTHIVTAHVRDAAGNTTDVQRSVVVAEAPGGGGAAGGGGSATGGAAGTSGAPSGSGAGAGGPTGAGPAGPTTGPTMALLGSKLRASRKGVVAVRLGCPAGTAGGCSGTVTLAQGSAFAAATRSLARRAFTAGPGASVTAKLKLARNARRKLARKGRLAVLASVSARDGAGLQATSTHAYTLFAPRR